jgi:hypothetical protein
MAPLKTTSCIGSRTVRGKTTRRQGITPEKENRMDIQDTVRRSTWQRRSIGRRLMSDDAPFFTISDPDVVGNRDALRRRALATLAGLGS